MAVKTNKMKNGYGLPNPLLKIFAAPVVSQRAPRPTDHLEVGRLWVDQPNNDVYALTSTANNYSTWINCGGGSGHFDSLTVTNDATITAGDFYVTAGSVTIGAFGAGVVQSSAAGLLSSSAGTNGQILVGSTGLNPVWASITSATLNITGGAGTLQIEYPGGTAASFITDVGGPVVPLLGATTIHNTDTNIIIDGSVANTITLNLADDIVSVASITAGVDLEMSSGICTIDSDNNAANAIYLHADGGVNETINIHSDQGTGVGSVTIQSDVGGLTLLSGLASADAINITASNAAGGIDIDAGTNGMNIALANGAFALTTGTGNITIGTDAVQHNTTIGSTTGTAALTLQSGTGDVNVTSTDEINLDATGVLELNSSGGVISIANDNVNQNVNISTQGVRTTTIGDATGASSVVINVGTGNLDLGVTGTAHTVRLGSTTGASATTIQSGTGALGITGGGNVTLSTSSGTLLLDSTGVLELNSSAGVIGIGNDNVNQNINIGIAGTRTVTIGSNAATSSVVIDTGTGNLDLGVTATAHTTRLGSTNTTSATTIQTGSGAMTFTAGGIFDVNAAGNVTIDSSAGTIGIGVDNVAQNINIGTAGVRVVTIGTTGGAQGTVVNAGSAGIQLNAAGLSSVECGTQSAAAANLTLSVNAGRAVFTGLTTAAGATQRFTITNTLVTANSAILVSVANKSAGNDCKMTMEANTPGAGSFTVDTKNNGTQALDSDVIITFWVLDA